MLDKKARERENLWTGWRNYYRHVVSKHTFNRIDQEAHKMTTTWLRKKHGRIPAMKTRKYFKTVGKDLNNLYDEETGVLLLKMKKIPINRFVKVRKGMRVYDSDAIEYWNKREYITPKTVSMGHIT